MHKKFRSTGTWKRRYSGSSTKPQTAIVSSVGAMNGYARANGIINKLLVVVTDGAYVLDKRYLDARVHNQGIKTLQIKVGDGAESFPETDSQFNDNIHIMNFNELEGTLAGYIKKLQKSVLLNL